MENKHRDDLSHIRSMMERSSRFISLSGLSGICAGVAAIIGAGYAYSTLEFNRLNYSYLDKATRDIHNRQAAMCLIWDAVVVLLVSITGAILFTISKSKKLGVKIWTTTTKHLLIQLAIPLAAGGIFCIALMYWSEYIFIAPATLVFYGLALINASKFTYNDIMYLGLCETVLGLIALFFPGHELLFWATGFGILHIIYGVLMYKKHK